MIIRMLSVIAFAILQTSIAQAQLRDQNGLPLRLQLDQNIPFVIQSAPMAPAQLPGHGPSWFHPGHIPRENTREGLGVISFPKIAINAQTIGLHNQYDKQLKALLYDKDNRQEVDLPANEIRIFAAINGPLTLVVVLNGKVRSEEMKPGNLYRLTVSGDQLSLKTD